MHLSSFLKLKMIRGQSKYGVVLLITLGLWAGGTFPFSQPTLAQTKLCGAKQIDNNIKNLLTNPALVDALATCGSDALPILLHYLEQSDEAVDGKKLEEFDYQRLLIVTAIGQMGSRASSSARHIAELMGPKVHPTDFALISGANLDLAVLMPDVRDIDRATVYALWQINGDPIRILAEIAVDNRENFLHRLTALHNLQSFARDYANLIPSGVDPASLKQITDCTLVTIALNSNDVLDFRLQAFIDLKEEGITPGKLSKIQNAITSTLLGVIQNQAKKPEERVYAVAQMNYMLTVLKTSIQSVQAQSIAQVLTQTILETSNTELVRNDALSLLKGFDSALAEKIEKEVSLPPVQQRNNIETAELRTLTVVKLQKAPPAICRYPLIKTVFAWKCR